MGDPIISTITEVQTSPIDGVAASTSDGSAEASPVMKHPQVLEDRTVLGGGHQVVDIEARLDKIEAILHTQGWL